VLILSADQEDNETGFLKLE